MGNAQVVAVGANAKDALKPALQAQSLEVKKSLSMRKSALNAGLV